MSVGEEVKYVGGKEVVLGNEQRKLLFMFSVPIFSILSTFFERKDCVSPHTDSTAVRKIKEINEKKIKKQLSGKRVEGRNKKKFFRGVQMISNENKYW